jgi:hypothetical protein
MYGTFCLYGYLIGRDDALSAEMARLCRATLVLATLAFVALRGMVVIAPTGGERVYEAALTFVVYLSRWSWLRVVPGWSQALPNRPVR